MRRKCEAMVTVDASADSVWAVISDVTRVGEWSGECQGCAWENGTQAMTPGARFRGRNRRGGIRWTRVNEVTLVQRPRTLVWRTVARPPYPDSVEWRLILDDDGEKTRVSESFEVLDMPRLMEWLVWFAMPAHRDRTADLVEDLSRLKVVVESGDGKPGR